MFFPLRLEPPLISPLYEGHPLLSTWEINNQLIDDQHFL